MFQYTTNGSHGKKSYLQVDLVPLIDRSTDEGKEIWSEIIDHGCFRGNDTMMVFERFFGECQNSRQLDEVEQEGHIVGAFERFMVQQLHEWGYFYTDEGMLRNCMTGELLHGTLLDITW